MLNAPLPLIIGTIGHVDHGKTSLVRSLTSFETDRHPEEKARGLSIDFAVAPYFFKESQVIGILDVPGHLDFIRNMTAGASSIDIALLIVASDDGVMPQTREHIQILSHLGVKAIIPVITKIDTSDETLISIVSEEVANLVSRLSIKVLPTCYVSNVTGQGIEVLKSTILEAIQIVDELNFQAPTSMNKAFRMYVRTAFSFKGVGTVLTGIPTSGVISTGDRVTLLPHNSLDSSIRAIHNYREETSSTQAFVSSAINIRKLEVDEVERGMVLVTPEIFLSTKEIYTSFYNSSSREVLRGRDYQVHIGTLSVTARVSPIGSKSILPEQEGMLRIRFHRAIQTSAGDRFLLRDKFTCGGGRVLSIFGRAVRKKFQGAKLQQLLVAKELLEEKGREDLCELVASGESFLSSSKLSAIVQNHILESQNEENLKVNSLVVFKDIFKLSGNLWFNLYQKASFEDKLERILIYYHSTNPFQVGMHISNLDRVFSVEGLTISDLTSLLSKSEKIRFSGHYVQLTSFKPPFSLKEMQYIDKIQGILGSQPGISKGNLLEELRVVEKDVSSILSYLEKGKIIFNFSNFYFLSDFVYALRRKTQTLLLEKVDGFTIAEFRDYAGVSRNQSVPILEYLDREGITKRVGDKRVKAGNRSNI